MKTFLFFLVNCLIIFTKEDSITRGKINLKLEKDDLKSRTSPEASALSVIGNKIYDSHMSMILIIPSKEKQHISFKNDKNFAEEPKKVNLEVLNLTVNNITYSINTTDNTTDCIPECYVNCQVHFPDPTEQMYCLSNVCHCEVVQLAQRKLVLLEENAANASIANIGAKVFNEDAEKTNYYFLMAILFLLLLPPLAYYIREMFIHYKESMEISYEYPFSIPEYMLITDS